MDAFNIDFEVESYACDSGTPIHSTSGDDGALGKLVNPRAVWSRNDGLGRLLRLRLRLVIPLRLTRLWTKLLLLMKSIQAFANHVILGPIDRGTSDDILRTWNVTKRLGKVFSYACGLGSSGRRSFGLFTRCIEEILRQSLDFAIRKTLNKLSRCCSCQRLLLFKRFEVFQGLSSLDLKNGYGRSECYGVGIITFGERL